MNALRIGAQVKKFGPCLIVERRSDRRAARYAPRRRSGTRSPGAPAAIGAVDQQHDRPQCATAAAAASSIRRPVRKRSSVNGAAIGCGSPVAIVCGEDMAGARRRLEAAGAPAAIDEEARHRRLADDRRAVRRDVDDAAPVAQHAHAAQRRERARRWPRAYGGDVQAAGLRVGHVGVGAGADDEFALVGLRDVGVHRVRHHDAGHHRLDRLATPAPAADSSRAACARPPSPSRPRYGRRRRRRSSWSRSCRASSRRP